MRVTTNIALVAALFLTTGCGGIPLRAGADFEPTYDFGEFASYTWDQPDARPTGDPRLDSNPFFLHRPHAAMEMKLQIDDAIGKMFESFPVARSEFPISLDRPAGEGR